MPGTHEGTALVFPHLPQALKPFDTKPQARKLVEADGANLVLLSFKKGQIWREHHSVHPVVVQVLSGAVDFEVKGQILQLQPGSPIHLTAYLLHEVRATEDATVMVTMLTGERHDSARINLDGVHAL
ncbi:cupin domain-containing protein [Rothia endophytica]|uniref:Cupin domain-containing protein n=1 Tax=Rothia endophytica TaxID=1324766 RepID=A0ABP9B5K7_9MICC|nr:Uncharacterised protein [Mycobacteroides abscessus subsp. bolletii]